jgi:predicted DNA-binding helix-hairpin-helix protein
MREHRLYQADWLMRYYGFASTEILDSEAGMLDLEIDPKLAWALRHRDQFPVDINNCTREELLRVPGLGVKTVDRLLAARNVRKIHYDDLQRLHLPLKRVLPFIKVPGDRARKTLDAATLESSLRPNQEQLSLFTADA